VDADSFAAIVNNYGSYLQANSAPDCPARTLFSTLELNHVAAGELGMITQVSGTDPAVLNEFLAAMDAGMPSNALPTTVRQVMPWLQATQTLNWSGPNQRGKYKSAYLLTAFPERQVQAVHTALTDRKYANPQAMLEVDFLRLRDQHGRPGRHRGAAAFVDHETAVPDLLDRSRRRRAESDLDAAVLPVPVRRLRR